MKNRKRALFLILLVVLLSGKSLMPVYAMETALHLPVEVVLEGDRPVQPETFVIQMKALTQNAPMPEQSEGHHFVIEMQGQGKKEIPAIKFTQPGIYQYEIRQKEGNAKNYTYDSCVYNITVYCTSDASKELEITVVALEEGDGEVKKDKVCFVNRYESPKSSEEANKPAKTGDDTPVQIVLGVLLISGFFILVFSVKRHVEKRK